MNLRVMFSQHLILHTVALSVALLWIPGFCNNCSSQPVLTAKFDEVMLCLDVVDITVLPDWLWDWLVVFEDAFESIAWRSASPMLDDYCTGDHCLWLQHSHTDRVRFWSLFTSCVSSVKNLRGVPAVVEELQERCSEGGIDGMHCQRGCNVVSFVTCSRCRFHVAPRKHSPSTATTIKSRQSTSFSWTIKDSLCGLKTERSGEMKSQEQKGQWLWSHWTVSG